MGKKTLKIKESVLRGMVLESMKKVLNEIGDEGNYYGGGLPDKYFENPDDVPDSFDDDCDMYIVTENGTNEIIGVYHSVKNAIEASQKGNYTYGGYHFSD